MKRLLLNGGAVGGDHAPPSPGHFVEREFDARAQSLFQPAHQMVAALVAKFMLANNHHAPLWSVRQVSILRLAA